MRKYGVGSGLARVSLRWVLASQLVSYGKMGVLCVIDRLTCVIMSPATYIFEITLLGAPSCNQAVVTQLT